VRSLGIPALQGGDVQLELKEALWLFLVKRSDIDSSVLQRLPRQADPAPDPALGSAASGHPEE
jgi:hypothetical protein